MSVFPVDPGNRRHNPPLDEWPASLEYITSQIEQVLLNILVNAWHAMPGGGEIFLKSANVEIDTTVVRPYRIEPGPYVCMSVTDTGVGMDQVTLQRIFEPFFTTKEIGRGTGLGLASAYGIIKNHDGIITVSSVKGEGATFTIYLPASEKEVVEEKELPEEVVKGTETLLLVDDEDMVLEVGEEILKELGYTILIASSGKEAIELYKSLGYEIRLEPAVFDEISKECRKCLLYQDYDKYKTIYIRPRKKRWKGQEETIIP